MVILNYFLIQKDITYFKRTDFYIESHRFLIFYIKAWSIFLVITNQSDHNADLRSIFSHIKIHS